LPEKLSPATFLIIRLSVQLGMADFRAEHDTQPAEFNRLANFTGIRKLAAIIGSICQD
jgi:hypothetical protein